ncbi:MAG: hypothetical protein M3068_00105 [Gemmatimonadota bacterium]|nr:hypothetical protein [Gemmatimonadota bacterium]
MHSNTRVMAVRTLAVILAVGTVACGKKDSSANGDIAANPAPAPAPAKAITVSTIDIGRHIGSDKHISHATDSFGVRDTIYASIITDGSADSAKIQARFTFDNGNKVVKDTTLVIRPTGGTTATEFHIAKATPWPKGGYRLEVFLNGTSAGSKNFSVK